MTIILFVQDAKPQWESEQDGTPAKLNVAKCYGRSPMSSLHSAATHSHEASTSQHRTVPDPGISSEQADCACSTSFLGHGAHMDVGTSVVSATASAAPDPRNSYHISDPVPNVSLSKGHDPVSSVHSVDSLEKLMETVKAEHAALLDEIKLMFETTDSHHVQDLPDATVDDKRGKLQSSHVIMEKIGTAAVDENGMENNLKHMEHDKRKETHRSLKPHSVCKCKKKDKGKKELRTPKKQDEVIYRTENVEMDHSDTRLTEVHSEYSYEHNIVESSSTSGSTSYEGVKIIVSVSELSKELYQPALSPKGKKVILMKSPQKICNQSRKIYKRRHKIPEAQLIASEREFHIGNGSKSKSPRKVRKQEKRSRDLREKGTMTADLEFQESDKNKTNAYISHELQKKITSDEKAKHATSKICESMIESDKKWEEVLEKSTSSKKNSSESTLYMSPPEQIVSSNIEHLTSLLATVREQQRSKDVKSQKMNPLLVHYISRLLAMSRESVENLGVSSTDISTPEIESSSGESISMNVQVIPEQSSLLKNMQQKTNKLPCPYKAPCSEQFQHIPGTSTPEEEEEPDRSKGSETKDIPYLNEIFTPFELRLKDMSLDDYKSMKFPDIFPEYSERCSKISNLAQRIEQIRKEQQRLMNNISASSSSSGSGQEYDSTRYISPPQSVTITAGLGRTGNIPQQKQIQSAIGRDENISPHIPHKREHCHGTPCSICCVGTINLEDEELQNVARELSENGVMQSSQSFYITPPESTIILNNNNNGKGFSLSGQTSPSKSPMQPYECVPNSRHENGLYTCPKRISDSQPVSKENQDILDDSGIYLQGVCGFCPQDNGKRCNPNKCLILREARPHTRPPSVSQRRNFQRLVLHVFIHYNEYHGKLRKLFFSKGRSNS